MERKHPQQRNTLLWTKRVTKANVTWMIVYKTLSFTSPCLPGPIVRRPLARKSFHQSWAAWGARRTILDVIYLEPAATKIWDRPTQRPLRTRATRRKEPPYSETNAATLRVWRQRCRRQSERRCRQSRATWVFEFVFLAAETQRETQKQMIAKVLRVRLWQTCAIAAQRARIRDYLHEWLFDSGVRPENPRAKNTHSALPSAESDIHMNPMDAFAPRPSRKRDNNMWKRKCILGAVR